MTTAIKDKAVATNAGAVPAHRPVIKVLAIGGTACKVVAGEHAAGQPDPSYFCLDTDSHKLEKCCGTHAIHLGQRLIDGLGTAGKPEVARQAVKESQQAIRDAVASADIVLIIAGLGGGTGSGAAPAVAAMAREAGAYVVATVTQPFGFEAAWRHKNAERAVNNLKRHVDSLLVVSLDDFAATVKETSDSDALDEVLDLADRTMSRSIRAVIHVNSIDDLGELDLPRVKPVAISARGR